MTYADLRAASALGLAPSDQGTDTRLTRSNDVTDETKDVLARLDAGHFPPWPLHQEAAALIRAKDAENARLVADRDAAVGAVLAEAVDRLDLAEHDAEERDWRSGANAFRSLANAFCAHRPDATAALERALTRAREVKPLAFDDKDCAVGIGCRYLLAKDYDGWRWFQTSLGGVLENVSTRVFRERDDVVTAAQADYAARITAALQPMGEGQ